MTQHSGRADVAGWTDEFVDAVFPAEYQTVMARRHEVVRRAAEREGRPPEQAPDRAGDGPLVPSTRLRLFGLAFSGGGIRSATFNLGLLQALAKRGLLSRFDYLSTVSGGGFIGSCLSALLNRPEADSAWTSRFPFYMESGRQEPLALRHLRQSSNYLVDEGARGYFSFAAVLLRGILVNILSLVPVVIAVVGLTHLTYGTRLTGGIRAGIPWYALTMGALAVFGLAVALFPLLVWTRKQRKDPVSLAGRSRGTTLYGTLLALVVMLAIVESLPLVLRWYHQETSGGTLLEGATWASIASAAAPALRGGSGDEPGPLQKLGSIVKLLAAAAAGPLVLLMIYLVLARWVVYPSTAPLDPELIQGVVYGVGAALLVYSLLLFDANATSIHQYYRDRLSLAYLFQVDPAASEAVRRADALRLSELNAPGTVAPYHLVNTTMNLLGSKDPDLRGRKADFFLISKHYTGSIRAGYCATQAMEAADRHLNLGTAMAISGAAASPSMGTMTIRSLALLMMLLNVRLGYWLISPRRAAARTRSRLGHVGAGLAQLGAEALSRTTATGRHVNVSDGAHIENLGVYELLRRRCRMILCSDAGADPDMAFADLATVVRYAATDMGVHIDINLEGLRPDADGRSKQHHAIGRIDYGDGEVGWLLYVKLSIGERELPYIEQYRQANPDFPHQSTGDQFFDDAQFEAYRALGYKVGLRTLEALTTLEQAAEDDELFEFGTPGQPSSERPASDQDASADAVEDHLRQRFRPAADPEPPW